MMMSGSSPLMRRDKVKGICENIYSWTCLSVLSVIVLLILLKPSRAAQQLDQIALQLQLLAVVSGVEYI